MAHDLATLEQDEEHEALIQFLYMAPIGLAQTGIDGEIEMINPLCAQLLMPLSRDGGLSNLFVALERVAPDLRHRARTFAPAHGMVCDTLHMQLDAGVPGKADPKILSLSLLKLDPARMMAVVNDVTVAVRRERQLRQSEAWFNAIFTGVTGYALMAIDHAGRVESWNASIEGLTGFDAAAVEGQTCALFYPPGGMPTERALDRLHEADRSGWSLDEGWLHRADGSRFWGSCLIAPLEPRDPLSDMAARCPAPPEKRTYSLIIRDMSERHEANEGLRRAVSCDHLTGLNNRRAFFDAGELEMQRWRRAPRPLSVLVIDADHFKFINDRFGHAAGDSVLRELAARLTATFRGIDVPARIGGEEFAVLMPGADLDVARAAAIALCERVAATSVECNGTAVRFTVSAGVAAMQADVPGLDALLRRADEALYAAKANGRNRVETWSATQSADAP